MVFINLVPSPCLKLSIFFSSVFKNSSAYLDKLLKAYMYLVRVFVPCASFINSAAFIIIGSRGIWCPLKAFLNYSQVTLAPAGSANK